MMRTVMVLATAGFRHRPWQAGLTALAVALGVMVMVTLQAVVISLNRETASFNAGPEAGADWIVGTRTGTLPPEVLAAVGALPEVAWAVPRNQAGVLVDLGGGAVTRAILYAIDPQGEAGAGLLRLVEGELPGPDAPGVALRADAARSAGLAVGDLLAFYTPDGRRVEWPLTGLTGREGVGGAGGFLGLVVHRNLAAQLGLPDQPARLLVGLKDGAGMADWASARRDLLARFGASAWPPPPPYSGKSGGEVMLLIFSALGPLLSIFLIQNAFAISVRRRLQELALWRTIGATRRQVTAALLAEGAMLGLGGGAVGLAAGLGVGRGLLAYIVGFSSLPAGQSLSAAHIALPLWMGLASLAVAVAVTVAAALRPALAARQVSPAALRVPAYQPDPPVRVWYAAGWGVVAAVSLAASLAAGDAAVGLLFGAVHVAALMALLPWLVQAVSGRFPHLPGPYGAAATLGGRRMGEVSRRAVGGARTLTVATALLVGFGSISAAAWQATAAAVAADPSDLAVRGGITPAVEATLKAAPGVVGVQVLARFQAAVGQELMTAWAVGPGAGLGPATGEVIVGSKLGRKVGEHLQVSAAGGSEVTFVVGGILPEDWDGPATFYITLDDARRYFVPVPVQARIKLAPGVGADGVAGDLRQRLPGLKVETAAERWELARQGHREKLGTFTAILYILAGFGALGVIQTSLLSVYEQLPELALLRAAGATPGQNALLVLVQSALPCAAGGLMGAFGGALFGLHLVRWFAAWRGAGLSGGLAGWYAPVLFMIALSVLSSAPAVWSSARLSVAGALQQK